MNSLNQIFGYIGEQCLHLKIGSSALEMKLYIQRFIHHIGGLPDFSALKFTKYNQYESLIMPMVKYLESHGVQFQYDTKVTNVLFDIDGKKKTAKQIICIHNGEEETINLTVNDLVFVTNGSCTEKAMIWRPKHSTRFNYTKWRRSMLGFMEKNCKTK